MEAPRGRDPTMKRECRWTIHECGLVKSCCSRGSLRPSAHKLTLFCCCFLCLLRMRAKTRSWSCLSGGKMENKKHDFANGLAHSLLAVVHAGQLARSDNRHGNNNKNNQKNLYHRQTRRLSSPLVKLPLDHKESGICSKLNHSIVCARHYNCALNRMRI